MGTFGLWKYVSAHNVQYDAEKKAGGVDHLFLDMNGIMHTSFRQDCATVQATLKNVMTLVRRLIELYMPRKSLVIVFDGPAPTSKLKTQRLRRQSMLKSNAKQELNEAQIVTGGTFVLRCEEEMSKLLQTAVESGKLLGVSIDSLSRILLSGCRLAGEGESKIGQELRSIYEEQMETKTYSPDDSIVIIGNDSDLVLTCVACVPFHNFYIVHPYTLVATDVGELMTHWANAVPNRLLHMDLLPSFRMDFVFLALLGGGDHYPGIEDDWIMLWRKYRQLRTDGGFLRTPLIKGDTINWDLLRRVVAREHNHMQHYVGSKNKRKTVQQQGNTAPPEEGQQLIKGARWALSLVCGDPCPDYYYHYRGSKASLGGLRSALNSKGLESSSRVVVNTEPPLLPLQVYVAVIGAAKFLPRAVQSYLEKSDNAEKFATTTSVGAILTTVKEIFTMCVPADFTIDEQKLLKFETAVRFSGATATNLAEPTKAKQLFAYPNELDALHFRHLSCSDRFYFQLPRTKVAPKPTSDETPQPAIVEGTEKNEGLNDGSGSDNDKE